MQLTDAQNDKVDSNDEYSITKLALTNDLVSLLFRPVSVAEKLSADLEKLRVGVSPGPLCDMTRHSMCIDKQDLELLVMSRREYESRGSFER
eukprot:m.934 g.934  ORF g.934 m.934 type:complete len:92 (+) comp671_c0_seq1:397-672(+)